MKKKFLALVLTLAMVLSLVPVTALAVGENSPVTEVSTDANSPVQIKKSINDTGDKLTLEAYLTNEVTENVSTKPLDIVLVLDQSGSMAYNFEGNTTNKNTERRQYAMKKAVKNFIGKAYSENGTHKMAIVTFSEDAAQLANWTTVDASGRTTLINSVEGLVDTPSGATNVAAGMQKAQTLLNAQTNSDSQKVVIVFTDGVPTTQSDFNTNVANKAIAASKDMKDAEAVVYTVGIFNGANPEQLYGDKWNYEMNEDILCTGEVGSCWGGSWLANLFGNNDFKAIDVPAGNRFLNYLSSNFSGATEIGIKYGSYHPGHTGFAAGNGWRIDANFTRTASNYYLTATNADGLNSVFEKIIEEISTLEIEAGTDAILSDTLSEYFDLNIPEGATEKKDAITVEQRNCTGKSGNDYTWEKADPQPMGLTVTVNGKTINVTGFNYTENAVTATTKNGTTNYSGSKLVVTIPIKADTAYTNWKKGSNLYPTNNTSDNQAGLSNYKDKNGEAPLSTLLTESPEAEVTAYTVTYNWGDAPAGQTLPTDSRNYIPGQSYTVNRSFTKDTIVPDANGGSYQFSGWTDPNNGVMGTKDVTIIGSWKHTEPTTPDPTYTLTYDANGGEADLVPTDSKDYTSGETATLKYDPQPTHAKVNEKNVIFIGWSETKDDGKIYDKGDRIPNLIQSVTMNDNKIVYAVWGLDENGNNTPDVFEATVTYKIENGYWFDSGTDGPVSTDPVTAQFTLYEKKGNQWVAQNPTLGNTIPTGRGADAGYTADGWYKDSETTATSIDAQTPVTGDVTYTFKYVKVSTEATWDVSRSKIATNLDSNYESKVTLSLPSAEEKLVSDVVFVMDGSSSDNQNVINESLKLLEDLQKAIKQSDAAVNVCIVKFKRQAFKSDWFDLSKDFNAIKIAMEENYSGGTNIHAGLLAGKEALEEHSKVSANRKYLILVSDGSTYLYSKDGDWENDKPFTRSYYTKENYNGFAGGFNDQGLYNPSNGPTGYDPRNVARPTKTSDVTTWQAYLNDVKARNETVNSEGKTGDDYDYHCEYDNNFNKGIPSADFKSQPCEPRTANNRDMAFYYADQTWQEMKEGGYHLFSIAVKDDSAGAGNADDSRSFMNYLNEGKSLTFSDIQNEVIYAVSAGSTVIDTIGEKFTFGGVDSFTLKVGTKEIKGVKDASDANTMNFGEKKNNGKYQYTVTYIPDTKTFAWTINENVSNYAPVQLTYTVKLTKPETAAATYGQTDLNGDTFIDGTQTKVDTGKALYTNQSATLVPVNSAGKPGQLSLFPMPSVSYTIKGSSGGHGGGTVTIPDDVPTGLNGKDHYAYVVGYPDGMVYPQKNITRAEVATIFFRLLTDETREANMTKSNSYNDMKDGAWYTCAVSTLSKMGIIKGYEDGSFKPDASISRAEFAAIAARFDPDGDKTPATFSDVSSHWAKDEISIAANHGWIKGYEDGSFKPDQKITRAETMTLVNRVLKRLPETKDDLHKDMKTWPDNQNESAWFYLAVQEATNSHYQKLKKDGTHETWESMRETRDWAALEK